MRPAISILFAILAAIFTMVTVFAIKRGVEWELQGASDTTLNLVLAAILVPAISILCWTYLLRPTIERRK